MVFFSQKILQIGIFSVIIVSVKQRGMRYVCDGKIKDILLGKCW